MTQTERILDYLTKYKSITQLEAVRDLGCYRLSARIADLKKEGYTFETDTVTAKNRFGDSCTFSRYKLVEAIADESGQYEFASM